MNKLRLDYKDLICKILFIIFVLSIPFSASSKDLRFEIEGNKYTDYDVILSLLDKIPDNIDDEYTNDIIKVLNNSNLFSDIRINLVEGVYIIKVKEFPNIDKLKFSNNERIDDEELKFIASQIKLINFNSTSISLFINEIEKLYASFGYNNISINYSSKYYEKTNTVDLYFEINEGDITKINQIFINGNSSYTSQEIKNLIKSKTKTIRNIFANNNYKPLTVERDKYLITNYYKNDGFINATVQTKIEYLKNNKVNIYFDIIEGSIYSLSTIDINDPYNILNLQTINLINTEINSFLEEQNFFSYKKIQEFKEIISTLIINSGIEFFEINVFDKMENNNIEILIEISPITTKYTKQINIIGNTRTFDYVIRRELDLVEGDAIYDSQINTIRQKLLSLDLFESVNISEEIIDDNLINLIINIEEKQTGTFNAGVSIGTLDGFAIITGLRERNFYGTGRSLDILLNTSEDKNQFKLTTTDRLSYSNDANISYSLNYKQQDLSKSSSYKLDTFSSGVGIGYRLNKNLYHNVELEYVLKDYKITNKSTVSNSILSSSGANISYLIRNNFKYSTLNSGLISKRGTFISYNNTIETPTSSANGFVKNIITLKQYHSIAEQNVFSIQARLGNIFSINNNDILNDDKFSLGGRWLRGFDIYGAGPRNSRTSYVGGNNILVTKLDYSYELNKNSNFPVYFNIFNDYGLVWENKTKPLKSDNNLRSSAGFGIKYYSPIGPIGFSWGFPLMDEEYDIKRMFLFSIGNID